MDHVTYFKGLFESTEDYRRIVLLVILMQNDKDLFKGNGY